MNIIIGLTGGIGCGKSTVANLFAEYGASIIDTDLIAHHLTLPGGKAIAPILKAFGKKYINSDGALDRTKMRSLIFSDIAARQQLEMILHPLILKQTQAQLDRLQDSPYVIVVVPLLAKTPDFQRLLRRVLVVECTEDHQIARVIKRNNMSIEEVRAIIAQQPTREERLRLADDVINNDGSPDNLNRRVAELHPLYSNPPNDI